MQALLQVYSDLTSTPRVIGLLDIRCIRCIRPSVNHIKELGQIHLGQDGFAHGIALG